MNRDSDNSNDWTNDETWAVRKWMINEPENTRSWHVVARELLDDEGLCNDQEEMYKALAAEIRKEAEDYCCSYSGCLASDLIEIAIARVNWRELAEELFSDLRTAPID